MALENNDITPFGIINFRNQKKEFGIRMDDRRRHMYVVGKTGMGKSNLLENMVIADIRAGKGVAVIDPHGEFAEKILDYIPEERIKDVVYFNPADINFPVAFNPLEQISPEFRHLVASGIMGVFKKIWVDAWSGRMEYILNNTLLALLESSGSTLLGIMRMLNDPKYRKSVVDNLKDPVVKGFWINEFGKWNEKFQTEATAAIQNKVGQFVANPLIRNILGQEKSSFDPRKVMDEGKILIVNLSKGRIGEDTSALLGAMIITKLQLAAMSRVDIPEKDRRDFYLYVDEFQNFATDFRYFGSFNIRIIPSKVDPDDSSSANRVLFKMYSIRPDQASTQIFLNTPIIPEATKCRNSGLICSSGLNATGKFISAGLKYTTSLMRSSGI